MSNRIEELTEQINELNDQRAEIKTQVMALVKEREVLEAGAIWDGKVADMNDAQIEALEASLIAAKNKPKAQVMSVEPIETEETIGVIGQPTTPFVN